MNDKNGSVNDFISEHLSPTRQEQEEISKRYNDLSSILKGPNFQSGSYARFTATTPVHDLDVIWVLPEESKSMTIRKSLTSKVSADDLDISNIISDLARKLQYEYDKLGTNVKVTPQTHSVTIEFLKNIHEFTIDVVPAVPLDKKNEFGETLFAVPEILKYSHKNRIRKYELRDKINWITTDPKGYIEEAKVINEKNESFRKSTKLLKSWKNKIKRSDDNFKFKSFHIEQLVTRYINQNEVNNTIKTVVDFFLGIEDFFTAPQIVDRANESVYVDSYVNDLTDEQKNMIIDYGKKALELVQKITDQSGSSEIDDILSELCIEKENTTSKSIYPIRKNNDPAQPWCSCHNTA